MESGGGEGFPYYRILVSPKFFQAHVLPPFSKSHYRLSASPITAFWQVPDPHHLKPA